MYSLTKKLLNDFWDWEDYDYIIKDKNLLNKYKIESFWTRDKDNNLQFKLKYPGLNKEWMKIEIKNNYLTLNYTPSKEIIPEEKNEFTEYIPFSYEWLLEKELSDIKKEDIFCKYLNGILLLTIKTPLKEKTKTFEVLVE